MKIDLVFYSHNFRRLAAFYKATFRLKVTEENNGHIRLENDTVELLILQAPKKMQDTSGMLRIDVAFKPVYVVDIPLTVIRSRASRKGGVLNPITAEWKYKFYTVCDGQDCDGNIFQVRSYVSKQR